MMTMAERITTERVHHIKLTVTDVASSRDFYTRVLNFDQVGEFEETLLFSNGSVMLGLAPSPDPARATPGDRFDENRVGLDHLSLAVRSREDLDLAMRALDAEGMPHGEITDLGEAFGICILSFRDPDNIQLELTSPRV
jgi:catechol 2,3-dioxygenase-like lactoylglutathione lyase family enzyme